MRPEEIREMSDTDIEEALERLADELFDLRIKNAYEEMESPLRIRLVRRDIARLKTMKRERDLAAARDAKEK
jgi:large subunit ribosomal protein L29